MSAHRVKRDLYLAPEQTDPGASGTILAEWSPHVVPLVSATAESRTLARPTRAGVRLLLYHRTDGGDITVTVTGGFNEDGDTTFTFSDPGQWAEFVSVYESAADVYEWRKVSDYSTANLTPTEAALLDGVTAGTVTASKVVAVDANKDVANFRNLRTTRVVEAQGAEAFDNTAGPLTITAAMVLGGSLLRNTNGASRTDVLPTAALLVAAMPGAAVGDIVAFYVANCATAAETITMSAGSGGTWNTNQPAGARIIPQNTSRWVFVRLTNVTASSEAYSAWM